MEECIAHLSTYDNDTGQEIPQARQPSILGRRCIVSEFSGDTLQAVDKLHDAVHGSKSNQPK